jgi:hypothetical protein
MSRDGLKGWAWVPISTLPLSWGCRLARILSRVLERNVRHDEQFAVLELVGLADPVETNEGRIGVHHETRASTVRK